jgi:A/G-specific adenine glycosylase
MRVMAKKNNFEQLAPALLRWWESNGRKDLPWQQNPTPYRVWISEIMLQQTQVGTVLSYYDRFMHAFPDAPALAMADLDRVLHLWSGLGYYARARNMHRAAKKICEEFDGALPADIDTLQSLPGIGRSTAGAILALSMGQSQPILDGNARRVLARVFGIGGWPGDPAVSRKLWAVAEDCTPQKQVAKYTQAIMDLGATICTRRKTRCDACPLSARCVAFQRGVVDDIPAPRPKRERPHREVVLVMVVRQDGAVLLEKRPDSGVWGGLWGFPETQAIEHVPEWCQAQVGIMPQRIEVRPVLKHGFTHFDLAMTPVEAHVEASATRAMEGDRWLWYNFDEPAAVGVSAPVTRILESFTAN